MGNRKSIAESLTDEQKNNIFKYFKNHTFRSTMRKFSLTRSALSILLNKYNILQHSSSESEILKHLEQDGYDCYSEDQINNIYLKYSELKTVEDTCTICGIKEYFLVYLLNLRNLEINYTIRQDKEWYEKLSNSEIQAIIDFYIAPNTLVETANAFNLTSAKVKTILKRASITLHSKEVTEKLGKTKQKQNLLAKYGVTNVFQLDSVKKVAEKTKLKKYNNAAFTNRSKASDTCIKKYGAATFLGSAAAKDQQVFKKSHDSWRANYLESLNDSAQLQLYFKCYNDREFTKQIISELPQNTVMQLAIKLNISHNLAYSLLSRLDLFEYIDITTSNTSFYEQEIADFIGKDLCVLNDRQALAPYELDIYVPSKKLAIEFNGTYWHSSLMKNKNYHFNKSILAEKAGIRLIHIYEYEWTDPIMQQKIKMMLNIALGRCNNKIYARQCTIKQITNKEASVLNNQIHLQGHRNAQVTYGLFYEDKLVQLMSFSHTKYNKNLKSSDDWEIIRGCPGSNNIVIGGVSKLLKHFIRQHHPATIFSYCDFNKFNGKSYENAGMAFIGYTGPDMKWLLKNGQVVNRQPGKHTELKNAAKAKIYGAGSKKYKLQVS